MSLASRGWPTEHFPLPNPFGASQSAPLHTFTPNRIPLWVFGLDVDLDEAHGLAGSAADHLAAQRRVQQAVERSQRQLAGPAGLR